MSAKLVTRMWSHDHPTKTNSHKEYFSCFHPSPIKRTLLPVFITANSKKMKIVVWLFIFISNYSQLSTQQHHGRRHSRWQSKHSHHQGFAIFQTCPRNLVCALGSSIWHQEYYEKLHQALMVHFCFTLQRLRPADTHDPRPGRIILIKTSRIV